MKKDRRRLLQSNQTALSLSATSGTAAAAANSTVTFTVKWNNATLKSSDVYVSINVSWATVTWTATNGTVKITCEENTSLSNSRTAIVSVEYAGLFKTYNLTQSKATFSLSETSIYAYCLPAQYTLQFRLNGALYTGSDVSVSINVSWATVLYNLGIITLNIVTWYSATRNGSSGGTNNMTRNATITATCSGQTVTCNVYQYADGYTHSIVFSDKHIYNYENFPDESSGIVPIAIKTSVNIGMSLMYMNTNSPDTGGNMQTIYWGGNYNVPNVTNYGTSLRSLVMSDRGGKEDTRILIEYDNLDGTSWQTANVILNLGGLYTHPAALCCWRFHTEGTNLGDWYLPSVGDYVAANLRNLTTVGGFLRGSAAAANNTIAILNYKYGTNFPYMNSNSNDSTPIYVTTSLNESSYYWGMNNLAYSNNCTSGLWKASNGGLVKAFIDLEENE